MYDDAEQDVPDLLMAISPVKFSTGDVALFSEHVQLFESLQWQDVANELNNAQIVWGVVEVAEAAEKHRASILYEAYDSSQLD